MYFCIVDHGLNTCLRGLSGTGFWYFTITLCHYYFKESLQIFFAGWNLYRLKFYREGFNWTCMACSIYVMLFYESGYRQCAKETICKSQEVVNRGGNWGFARMTKIHNPPQITHGCHIFYASKTKWKWKVSCFKFTFLSKCMYLSNRRHVMRLWLRHLCM